MAESICIHTAQGLVCYKNGKVRFFKTLKGQKKAEDISKHHLAVCSSVNEWSPWEDKLDALVEVARNELPDIDDWQLISRITLGSPKRRKKKPKKK